MLQSPLQEIRGNLNLSQSDLAQLSKVSQGHISQVELGNVVMSARLVNFLKRLNVDTDQIIEKQQDYIQYINEKREKKIKDLQLQS